MASENTPLVTYANVGDKDNLPSSGFSPSKKILWAVILLVIAGAFYAGSAAGNNGAYGDGESTKNPLRKKITTKGKDGESSAKREDTDTDGPPRYIATQFLSFTINTIGGIASKGECEGKPVDPSNGFCYLGNPDNITEDLYHRLAIVEKFLYRIKQDAFAESPDIDHNDDVLKIVMLPEFFWRGPYGAYSTSMMLREKSAVMGIGDRLRAYLADDFFNDFLFVFGTLISAESFLEPWEIDSATEVEYYNFAIVLKGGSTHQHNYLVTKKYISNADFLSRASLPNPKEENILAYSAVEGRLAKLFQDRQTMIITDNILEMDGLRIGLEICLDHRMGTLWNYIKTKNQPLVDVLLITSAGMAIERGPSPVVPGGVVYLSDGEASSAACMRTDHHVFHPELVCRGNVGGLKHIPLGGPGYTNFFLLSACWDIENNELLKGYYSMYQPQGCANTLKTYDIDVMDEFAYYPPSIEIYPTVALPEGTYGK